MMPPIPIRPSTRVWGLRWGCERMRNLRCRPRHRVFRLGAPLPREGRWPGTASLGERLPHLPRTPETLSLRSSGARHEDRGAKRIQRGGDEMGTRVEIEYCAPCGHLERAIETQGRSSSTSVGRSTPSPRSPARVASSTSGRMVKRSKKTVGPSIWTDSSPISSRESEFAHTP